jgi:hypothetical protein
MGGSEGDGAGRAGAGLVTLIVGETGRSGSGRGRGRRAPGGAPEAAPDEAPGVSQWSWRWASDGPEPGSLAPGCDGEPDLTLALSPDDARSVRDGELAPSVAFMQGRLKTTGDNGLLLRVLAWTATPAFAAALSKLAQVQ